MVDPNTSNSAVNNSTPVYGSTPLNEKITQMGQSLASDLAQGKSPDPSTQSILEDSSLLQNPPHPTTVPPPPPPVTPPPLPPVPPAVSTPAPVKHKSKLPAILFALIGMAIIVGIAFSSGLLTKIIPGLNTVTLTYWGLWEPNSNIRSILDEFEKSHPGIKVNYQYQSPQEYRERLQSSLSQNKGPDIFRIHNTWVPMFRNNLAPVPATVFSPADYQKTFYPAAVSSFRSGNNFVAVPLETDGIAMYINDDLLQKNHQTVPQNWDQLRDAALAMSVCENDTGDCQRGGNVLISGAALGTTNNVDHWQDIIAALMLQNNVNLSNPVSPVSKPADDVFDFYTSFVNAYHMWDPVLPNSTTSFALGKVGIYFGPSWRVFDIQAINPNLKFSVHPLPQLAVDPLRGEVPITYASFWAEAVNKNSPQAKQAWELLKFLSSPDIMPKLYQNETSPQRVFGEPYSRVDLADSLKSDKYVAPFINDAPLSQSWYLASNTYDGPTGLNSQLSDLFAKAVARTLTTSALSVEINKVLSAYGIVAAYP